MYSTLISLFGLHATLPSVDLPAEWHTMLATQAQTLAGILQRVTQAVSSRHTHGTRRQAQAHRLHTIVADAERRLTALTSTNVTLERQMAPLRALADAGLALPAEAAQRVHAIEQVNHALHANLSLACQRLRGNVPKRAR